MLFTHQKAKAPKGEIIYAVPKVCNLESEFEPRFINVQHRALSFMLCPAHIIHLEFNLWFYAVEEGTEPSWPLFRSGLDNTDDLVSSQVGGLRGEAVDRTHVTSQRHRHCFPMAAY